MWNGGILQSITKPVAFSPVYLGQTLFSMGAG